MTVIIPPDPIGKIITIGQAFLAAHGRTTEFDFRATTVRGTERRKEDAVPLVIIDRYLISDEPFGTGSGRTGVADYTFTVRCYGRKAISGAREAAVLANLLRACYHNHLPVVMGTVGLHRIRVISTGQPLVDPETQEPYVPVIIGLYASSLEAAS